MTDEVSKVTPAGGNVFLDLGFEPEEAARMKAESNRQIAAVQQRHAFERAMVTRGYFADLFEGRFSDEAEWSYHDPRATMMLEVWRAAQLAPYKEKAPTPITVEVSGPAGGKSAIAQVIAHVLTKLELNASTDLDVDLRSVEDLDAALAAIKARGTQIVVRETQTRKEQ